LCIIPIGDGYFGIIITALFLIYYLLLAVITLCVLSVTQVLRFTDLDIYRGPRSRINHKINLKIKYKGAKFRVRYNFYRISYRYLT